MPTTRTFFKSFSAGEISPEMFGRIDDTKYQQGAATMRNFVAKPQGPAVNRSGFKFVKEVKDSTKKVKLLSFRFNVDQTMVIEMGNQYFRFHTQGQTLQYPSTGGTVSAWSNSTNYVVGDLVTYGGTNYYAKTAHSNSQPPNATNWYALPADFTYEIPSSYLEAELFDIQYVQSGDVLTIVHPNHAPAELRRSLNATTNDVVFSLKDISFTAPIAAPTSLQVEAYIPSSSSTNTDTFEDHTYVVTSMASDGIRESEPHSPVSVQNNIFVTGANNTILWNPISTALRYRVYKRQAGLFGFIGEINHSSTTPVNAAYATSTTNNVNTLTITKADHGFNTGDYVDVVNVSGSIAAGRFLVTRVSSSEISYVTSNDQGSGNCTIAYVHQIVDNNIAPDFSVTPPIYDSIFDSTNNFPSAVSYYEQRRVFAGTNNEPQTIFMTRSGTESDMSFKLPIRDDDRIKFKVAAREANRIKHIVPLTQLLFMTEAAEWRVTSINSDAITPSSVSVKPQSYIGSNTTQPVIVNNSMVYISSRGGHARELGYNWQANGFITGDLSIRAAHLFDDNDIVDMALAKSPTPIVWMVNTTGKLIGLTYVPEQAVGAWHQHDTDGLFESVTTVAEGLVDAVYCVVKRTINGNTKRFVERMGTRSFENQRDNFFVDSGLTYDGTNTNTAKTVTITGSSYAANDTVTLAFPSSFSVFKLSNNNNTTDVDDAIVIVHNNVNYRLEIISITNAYTATVKLDIALPSALQNTAISTYEIAEKTLRGLTHLIGKTVNILSDGAVHAQRTVDSNGSIVLTRAGSFVHVGLPYTSDLQTLPLMLQAEAGGQGRVKNLNHAWLRVLESSGIFAGPSENKLTEAKTRTNAPYGSPPSLKTEDIKIMLTPTWADNGQIFIRQTDPLPLTVVGLTLEISVGG